MYQKVSIVEWLNNAHSVYNNFQILMLLNKKCFYSIHIHEHNASPYLAIEICLQNNGLNFGQSNSCIYIMSNPFDKKILKPLDYGELEIHKGKERRTYLGVEEILV